MALELFDSPVRVIWDPDGEALVLVPYGAPMWDLPALDGQQEIQTVPTVRGAGTKNYGRGNESHRLTFTLARLDRETVEAAFISRIENTLATSLPRDMKDVLLSFESGKQFRLKNAAVRSWPNGQEDNLTRETLVIAGGEIVRDTGTYTEGNVWGEIPANAILGEDGEPMLDENGDYILSEE